MNQENYKKEKEILLNKKLEDLLDFEVILF